MTFGGADRTGSESRHSYTEARGRRVTGAPRVPLGEDDVREESRAVLGARLLTEAYRELFDFRLPIDRADAFQRIVANRASLSEPLGVLFEQLSTGSSSAEPEALLDATDRSDPSLIDIERLVVARFLEQLQD